MTFDKAARFALDRERERLRGLDMQDGGSRLYDWTLKTFEQEDQEIMAARKAKAQTQAAELVAALNFVSVAATKDDAPYKTHVVLNNKFAVCCDGQITAGHPIAEELECCPHLGQLKAALAKTGDSLSIAELDNGKLSITGDKLAAKIPCIGFDALPDSVLTKPDPVCAVIDDRLRSALAVCGAMVSENGTRALECGMLLEANVCTGTNGKVLMQYWHGIDLPPNLFLPKIFAAAVLKIKMNLTGFGFTPGRSVTFYFSNGAWIKTQLYEDKYPDVKFIIDVGELHPNEAPLELFEAIETISEFNESGYATLGNGAVSSHNSEHADAKYTLESLPGNLTLDNEYAKMIAPYVKTIDLTTHKDRAFFFGENMRGVIMGIKLASERAPVETMAEWTARGGPDSEIPF